MTTLRAFHGDPKIKAKYLARVRRHAAADELVQGTGWADGKGCAIGCTLDAYDHTRYPVELGIPVEMAYLEDAIFELLPSADAHAWPEAFLRAIPLGSDVHAAYHRAMGRILREVALAAVKLDEAWGVRAAVTAEAARAAEAAGAAEAIRDIVLHEVAVEKRKRSRAPGCGKRARAD